MEWLEVLVLLSLCVVAYLFWGKELNLGKKYYMRQEMRRARSYIERKSQITQR